MSKLKCGLIGKKLSHSYSPEIHALLGDYSYELFEMEEEDVGTFLMSDSFDAVNVTIPYKKTVMPYLSEISDEALRIGSVNTVTHLSNGKLRGDNTDYYGFSYLLDCANIDVHDKKVLVLGSGGASMTARTVAADRGAREVVIISRSGENNYYNIEKHSDCDVIFNTTPVGMYPNNGESPVSLDIFKNLSGVVDMIYNPARTALILDAEDRGIPCISGLPMLVAQAKMASELFKSCSIDDTEILRVTNAIHKMKKNIILVGMPGCGKSTVGKLLAKKTCRGFVDLDNVIIQKAGKSIPDIFKEQGEASFRELEHACLAEVSKKSSLVIASGGGTPVFHNNIRLIRQNSTVIFLKRDISTLDKNGRPVSQTNDLSELYLKRLPFYQKSADYEIEVGRSPDDTVNKIMEILGL